MPVREVSRTWPSFTRGPASVTARSSNSKVLRKSRLARHTTICASIRAGILCAVIRASTRSSPQPRLRSESVSWLGPRAPFNGRVVEAECLNHKRSRLVEVLYRCAGPISCRASGGFAFAAQRNPFFGSQYVADTDRFLGVRWIDSATLIEAPRPGSTVRALKDLLTLLELFERKCGVHRADAISIAARLVRVTRHRGHARALFHSAEANCFRWVIRLRYAQSGCTKRILMFA